ncbi:MAG: fructosamine kinase family protein [Magnetovibrio sp.]|nr:fructosamine kinase family protein [Magnetovibrio sp.]
MSLADKLENILDQRPDQITSLSGGCVGDVFEIHLPDGRTLVAKTGDPDSGLDIEGRSIRYLSAHTNLPVPHLHHSSDTLLVMDFVANDKQLNGRAQHHAAEVLADLHAHTGPNLKGFGFAFDTVIGGLPQPNPWTVGWIDFFRDQRLMYMAHLAAQSGQLNPSILGRLEKFCGHLDRWLREPTHASLIHGDMWGGNVLSYRSQITAFIDPAIYFADPEIELAFSTLFNTFNDDFFQRYTELRPINPGFFEQRKDIYNLYPLLVHVRLFGGSYLASVDATLRKFGF